MSDHDFHFGDNKSYERKIILEYQQRIKELEAEIERLKNEKAELETKWRRASKNLRLAGNSWDALNQEIRALNPEPKK